MIYAIPEENLAHQLTMLNDGRVIQGSWQKDEAGGSGKDGGNRGRHLACLLGALDPKGKIMSSDACNGDWMPAWVAHLMPTLFDGVTKKRAIPLGIEWNRAMTTARGLDDEAWTRIKYRWLASTVRQALESARPKGEVPSYWPAVEKACLDVAIMYESGDISRAEAAYERQFETLIAFIQEECNAGLREG